MPQLELFAKTLGLSSKTEVDRSILLAFFFFKEEGKIQFSISDISSWFEKLHFSQPNISRLRKNLTISRAVVRGSTSDSYKIAHSKLTELEQNVTWVVGNEAIIHSGLVIPKPVYLNTRGYLISLCEQINSAYEHNIFDGCAVLMRRLMEILLILSFEHLGASADIQQADGTYVMLEKIIDRAKASTKLQLSRNSKETIEEFRRLGNFSAHKIYYTCKRDDIKKVALDFRALVEELFYKSGVRV